jgi:hypothetical protein
VFCAFLVRFQGIIDYYLEIGVGRRGSRRVSVRHGCKSKAVRDREDDGWVVSVQRGIWVIVGQRGAVRRA